MKLCCWLFGSQKAFIMHVIWLNNYEIIVENIFSNDFSVTKQKG